MAVDDGEGRGVLAVALMGVVNGVRALFHGARSRFLLVVSLAIGASTALIGSLNGMGTGFAWFVLAICWLRVYSLIRSDVWIWARGPYYRVKVNKKPESWRPDLSETLLVYTDDRVRGDFVPFGVRAIVLASAVDESRGWRRPALRTLYLLWKFYYFAPLVSVALFSTSTAAAPTADLPTYELLYWSGIALCLGCLAIAVEAALSFFTFGSWSLAYHRFDVAQQRGIAEISALSGGVVTAFVSAASCMALASKHFASFGKIPNDAGLAAIPLSLYFTLTSFTGNGDADPLDWHGFLLMALIYVEAAAFLVIVVSLLLDSLGSEPGIHLPWVRRDPSDIED